MVFVVELHDFTRDGGFEGGIVVWLEGNLLAYGFFRAARGGRMELGVGVHMVGRGPWLCRE